MSVRGDSIVVRPSGQDAVAEEAARRANDPTFLGPNGWSSHSKIALLTEPVLGVAERKRSKAEVMVFLQAHCRQV